MAIPTVELLEAFGGAGDLVTDLEVEEGPGFAIIRFQTSRGKEATLVLRRLCAPDDPEWRWKPFLFKLVTSAYTAHMIVEKSDEARLIIGAEPESEIVRIEFVAQRPARGNYWILGFNHSLYLTFRIYLERKLSYKLLKCRLADLSRSDPLGSGILIEAEQAEL